MFQQSLYLSFLSSIGSDLSENEENGDDDHDITDESEDEESLSELTFSGRYLLTFVFWFHENVIFTFFLKIIFHEIFRGRWWWFWHWRCTNWGVRTFDLCQIHDDFNPWSSNAGIVSNLLSLVEIKWKNHSRSWNSRKFCYFMESFDFTFD